MSTDLADELLGPAMPRVYFAASDPLRWSIKIGCPLTFTILGQPCSKANSRKIVTLHRGKSDERIAVVKSKEAIAYEREALIQIPPAFRLRIEGPVCMTLRIFYASERPDLDESIVLDVLQDRWAPAHAAFGKRELVQPGVYRNDRQVREKHVYHAIDKRNPRTEVAVQPLGAQQLPLA